MTSRTPDDVTRQRVHFPSNVIVNLRQNVNFTTNISEAGSRLEIRHRRILKVCDLSKVEAE